MATIGQIRGMLLEEAILYLLRWSGYKTVEAVGADPTLLLGGAGLEVKGRGADHQIDAIADQSIVIPFVYPQRLLVEAKCYKETATVGIDVVRNAVGVVKDCSELWTRGDFSALASRFHYLYAIFSTALFSEDAQCYAFAQDVHLFPLAESAFIRPVVEAIRRVNAPALTTKGIGLRQLREAVRDRLCGRHVGSFGKDADASAQIESVCEKATALGGACLAMIARRFPVFLVPARPGVLRALNDVVSCRFFYDHDNLRSWYLCRASDQRTCNAADRLFSFDLPDVLLSQYTARGTASGEDLLNLKSEWLHEMQALLVENDAPRVITFRLDQDWLHEVRQHMQERRAMRRPTDAE